MEECIGAALERIANGKGLSIAVCDRDTAMAYGELETWTARIAAGIVDAIGGRQQAIALVGYNDTSGVAGVLGALRTPHSLVAIDAETPAPAATKILEDLDVRLCLVAGGADGLSSAIRLRLGTPLLLIDEFRWRIGMPELRKPVPGSTVCALKLTSGTTGTRKCLEITQRAETEAALSGGTLAQLEEGALLTTASLIDTTAGRSSMLRTVLSGATYLPFDFRREAPRDALERLAASGVTHFHGPSTAFRLLADAAPPGGLPDLRCVHLGGEAVAASDATRVVRIASPECLLNMAYGSTEAGMAASLSRPAGQVAAVAAPVSLRPLDRVDVDVVDDDGIPVPPGQSGRVRIVSSTVALGWRGNTVTDGGHRFPEHGDGRRCFVSDDKGHMTPDGDLFLEGRIGTELKIRGRRVDLSFVERWMAERPEVLLAAVIPLGEGDSSRTLAAVVVLAGDITDPEEKLRRAMMVELPAAMRPTRLVVRGDLPLAPSGKIDRKALPSLVACAEDDQAVAELPEPYVALGEIWTRALGRAPNSPEANFFDLGGDSISATHLALDIETRIGQRVDLGFAHRLPRLRDQAEALQRSQTQDERRDKLIVKLVPEPSADGVFRKRCYLIPGVGGHVFLFGPAAVHLSDHSWDMTGVVHPRFRLEEPEYDSIETMAQRMLKAVLSVQQQDPLILVGYSQGGLVAHEMARQHEAAGGIAGVVVVDTRIPPGVPILRQVRARTGRALRRMLLPRAYVKAAPTGRTANERTASARKAFLHLSRRYRVRKRSGPTVLLSAQSGRVGDSRPGLGWEAVASELEILKIGGDHLTLMRDENLEHFVGQTKTALERLSGKLRPTFQTPERVGSV